MQGILKLIIGFILEKTIGLIRDAIAKHLEKKKQKEQDKKEIEEINSIPDAAKRAERMQAKLDSLRDR
jgi:Co/Zn/Cd efflux system component